ncbi:MAG: DNA-3-methyladenine glycosylase I [Anaerolineales bacterium]|nr:DNA-3-methyladenine glycosylase I [Anaerolineales bacterium]
MMPKRCDWAGDDPFYIAYHDQEWGRPVHNDRELFELLILEGAQAGLSWITILRKREGYRKAFDQFDPEIVAGYDQAKLEALRQDPGIIRNQLKIRSAVQNASAFLKVQEEFGSFNDYICGFVDHRPIQNAWKTLSQLPAATPLSEKISKDLKKRGFNFVGPTIVYAFMQSIGMVNDHTTDCFRYKEILETSG